MTRQVIVILKKYIDAKINLEIHNQLKIRDSLPHHDLTHQKETVLENVERELTQLLEKLSKDVKTQ